MQRYCLYKTQHIADTIHYAANDEVHDMYFSISNDDVFSQRLLKVCVCVINDCEYICICTIFHLIIFSLQVVEWKN